MGGVDKNVCGWANMETDFGLSVLYGNQRKPQPILSCNGCRNRKFKIPLKLKLIKRKNI